MHTEPQTSVLINPKCFALDHLIPWKRMRTQSISILKVKCEKLQTWMAQIRRTTKYKKGKKPAFKGSRNLEGARKEESPCFCCWGRMLTGLFVPPENSGDSYPSVDYWRMSGNTTLQALWVKSRHLKRDLWEDYLNLFYGNMIVLNWRTKKRGKKLKGKITLSKN